MEQAPFSAEDTAPPPAAAIGIPGAVDTKIGGPSSSTTGVPGGGVLVASCGTGITDCSVGVPLARSGIGRTGRHITTVVECDAAGLALGATRRARRTIGRRGAVAFTGGVALGTVLEATFLTGAFRRTTSFFLAGAATGEHSTSESTDAVRTAGF